MTTTTISTELQHTLPILKPKAEETCRWFLGCSRPATGTIEHPILGTVPVCDHCREWAE